jgi:anti-sigma factor RsiW
MTCLSVDHKPDWKAYALGELDAESRRQAEAHAASCASCREELDAVRVTLDALSTLREEEIPRRIAFVSDKVFAPRWWQAFLRPSFAAACVIAAAILVHAFVRPSTPVDSAAVQATVNAAVTKAVTDVEERHAKEMSAMLADYEILSRQVTRMYVVDTGLVRQ